MRFSSLSLAIVVTLTLGVESVQLQRTLHQESQQLDLESQGSLDEASSLSATCGSVKCAAAAGRVYSVRNCQPGTVSIARAGSFFKARRAQCVEKFLCDSRNPYLHDGDFSPSKTVTCTRSNNWVGAANCRSCRAENNPRIKSNFQLSEVEHMNARIRTVCYERKSAHSRLWLSTGLIDVGGFLASAYYTDNMPEEYRLKFTRGRAGAGITLDRETVCQCARLHEPKSIRQIKAVIERYAKANGPYGQEDNNCRHFAGWTFRELSVQNPPNFGYQYSCQPDKRRDGDLDRLEAERPASAQEFLKSVVPRSERFTQCRWDVA